MAKKKGCLFKIGIALLIFVAPAYVNGTTGGELYGQPIEFVRNGAWDNKRADIITGNFKYAVVGMRAGRQEED